MEHKHRHKECEQTMAQICEDLGEDINSEFCKEVKQHLDKCPECYASVNALKKTVYLYQLCFNEDVPQNVEKRLWRVLNLNA